MDLQEELLILRYDFICKFLLLIFDPLQSFGCFDLEFLTQKCVTKYIYHKCAFQFLTLIVKKIFGGLQVDLTRYEVPRGMCDYCCLDQHCYHYDHLHHHHRHHHHITTIHHNLYHHHHHHHHYSSSLFLTITIIIIIIISSSSSSSYTRIYYHHYSSSLFLSITIKIIINLILTIIITIHHYSPVSLSSSLFVSITITIIIIITIYF